MIFSTAAPPDEKKLLFERTFVVLFESVAKQETDELKRYRPSNYDSQSMTVFLDGIHAEDRPRWKEFLRTENCCQYSSKACMIGIRLIW